MHRSRESDARIRLRENRPLTKNKNPIIDLSPSQDLAYLLGVYFGDASIDKKRRCFTLLVVSKPFAESTAQSLRNIGFWSVKVKPTRRKTKAWHDIPAGDHEWYFVGAFADSFVSWIESMTGPDKSPNEKVPEFLSTPQFKAQFLRGMFESEGTYSPIDRGEQIIFSNTNYNLLALCKNLLEQLGFVAVSLKLTREPTLIRKAMYKTYFGRREQLRKFMEIVNPIIKNGK